MSKQAKGNGTMTDVKPTPVGECIKQLREKAGLSLPYEEISVLYLMIPW